MDINQLKCFLQIVKDGSYTQAARTLYVSQSSLSKMMKKLRNEIGQDLFELKYKKPVLTYAGQRLLESAKVMIQEYENVLGDLQGPRSTYMGRITVGIPPLITTCFFAPIVAGFRSLYPNIEVNILEKGAKVVQDAVDKDNIDIGIIILPVYEGKFNVTRLISDETVLVVSKNHPLANRQSVKYSDLVNEKFILLNEEFILYHQITSNCRDAGFEPVIWGLSGQWDYITELVSLEYGVSILPRPIFLKRQREDIRLIKIDQPEAGWHVVAITKKDKRKTGAVKLFVEYTKQNIIL